MGNGLQLMAAVHLQRTDADMILESLKAMHRAYNIDLVDAAIVNKDIGNKIHVHETRELTGKRGAKRGTIVGGLFGLIFPPSLIGTALVGAGIGTVAGKLRDTGIQSDSITEIAERLHPGDYALIALVESESAVSVEHALSSHGRLIKRALPADEVTAIEQVASEQAEAATLIA